MRTAAFNWVEFEQLSSLRYNFANVACVKFEDGRWWVELHHWRGVIRHPVASRATGKRYVERWADRQDAFWTSPYRKHDRRLFRKNLTVRVPGFD